MSPTKTCSALDTSLAAANVVATAAGTHDIFNDAPPEPLPRRGKDGAKPGKSRRKQMVRNWQESIEGGRAGQTVGDSIDSRR
jgi:hypothetical protein